MNYFFLFIIILVSFLISYKINLKINNFDEPGESKIHKKKILTSGGLVPFFILTFIIAYLIYSKNENFSLYYYSIPQIWLAPISILILIFVSFFDDLNFIPFQLRLFIQLSIVFLCISLIPVNYNYTFQTPIFNGNIPIKLDIFITIIFWAFIINSTNFIDGYDGMFSFQIISNFLGLSIIFYFLNENFHFLVSLMMFFIGVIFLPFNLGKKFKMFIGDTGTIPAGFILGWMIISLINMGYFFSAVILNIFFITDVILTLLKRLINKRSIFIRHNDFLFKKMIIKYGTKNYFIFGILIQITLILLSLYLFSIK